MRRRADRKLHLDLLRARAAADRIELTLAIQAISQRVEPVRRLAGALEWVGAVLGSRGRPLGLLAAVAGAVLKTRLVRSAVRGASGRLGSAAAPGARRAALAALIAAVIGLLIRPSRRSQPRGRKPREDADGETG